MSAPKAPQNHFTLLYFAVATSYTHKHYDFFPAPLPVGQLYEILEKRYPGMRKGVLDCCALTVNLEYVDVDEEGSKEGEGLRIQSGDEVAIIPPVSSG